MHKLKPYAPPGILLLAVFLLLALSGFLDGDSRNVAELFFTNMVMQIVVFVLPSLFYCRIGKKSVFHKDCAFSVLPFHPIFLLSLFCVIVLGSMLINLGMAAAMGTAEEFGNSASSTLTGITGTSGALYVIFSFCILPAVTEEFFFRGVLMSEYAAKSPLAAMILTTVAFALSHFDPVQLPVYLFSGFLLAFSLRITRSILTPILLHAAFNLFNIFLLPYLWQITLGPLGVLFTVFILVGLILIAGAVALREAELIYMDHALSPRREQDRFGKASTFWETLAAAGTAIPYLGALLLALLLSLLT